MIFRVLIMPMIAAMFKAPPLEKRIPEIISITSIGRHNEIRRWLHKWFLRHHHWLRLGHNHLLPGSSLLSKRFEVGYPLPIFVSLPFAISPKYCRLTDGNIARVLRFSRTAQGYRNRRTKEEENLNYPFHIFSRGFTSVQNTMLTTDRPGKKSDNESVFMRTSVLCSPAPFH